MHSVCILLATYNGAKWLPEQLDSISQQLGVRPRVVASDDQSTDNTLGVLSHWSNLIDLTVLNKSDIRFGSAHRNFLRLVRDAPIGDCAYVALCDQDDIWLPDKLNRAIQCLQSTSAAAFSSDVTAFWPDGRQQLVLKSQRQRRHDYLFGSPGPGCTFVWPVEIFRQMRAWVIENFDQMQDIWVHDWLMYAYIRAQGLHWHIDDVPLMLYRQHGLNEIGANRGLRAALARWRHVRTGSYRRDILSIARVIQERSPVVSAVNRLNGRDRLWLMAHAREFRRSFSECLVLAGLLLFMPRTPTK
jgi:rhamnosyltransferase